MLFSLKVVPNASRDKYLGLMDDGLTHKIKLRAEAVDGRANEALVEFLSSRLRISKSSVNLVSGQSSRLKRVEISGISDLSPLLSPHK